MASHSTYMDDSETEEAPLIALGDDDDHGHDVEVAGDNAGFNGTANGHATAAQVNTPALRLKRSARWYQAKTPRSVVLLMTWLICVMTLSGSISVIPIGRIIESVLCQKFYDTTEPIPEEKCKGDEVQTELAWIGAFIAALEAAIHLVVAFPWSILSDRWGRKPIFLLAYGSLVLGGIWSMIVLVRWDILPIRLLLLSPFFGIFGGGVTVLTAVLHSIIADVATEKASAFMLISIGAVAGGISGPALSGLLMQKFSPWVPLIISGWVLVPIILVTFIFLPETLPNRSSKRLAGIPSINKSDATSYFSAIRKHTYEAFGTLRTSLSMVRNRSMAILLSTFLLLQPIERCLAQVLAQTLTKRFHWQLAQLGYFFSVRGLAAVLVLALLPILANYMTAKNRERPFSIFGKDMLLTQASFLSLITGLLLMSGENFPLLIVGQVVATLASGLASFQKALVVAYVKPEETSRLFALTGMLETVGALVGAPSMTWAFAQGVKMGGIWMGLPFWYAACLCAVVFTAICFVRRPSATMSEASEGSDMTTNGDGPGNGRYTDVP